MNKVILVGGLGADPELKVTSGGKQVCTFRMATSEGKESEWHNVQTWDKTAELCAKFLSKGKKVAVDGHLRTESWEKDGVKHYKTLVVANRVEFLSPKGDGAPYGESGHGANAKHTAPQDDAGEDIPF